MPYVVHNLSVLADGGEDGDGLAALQAKLNEWEQQGFVLNSVIPSHDGDHVLILHQPEGWQAKKARTGQVHGF